MAVLFDIDAVLEEMKGAKPPHKCPNDFCGKSYKTYTGIAQHVVHCSQDRQDLSEDEKPVNLPLSR